MSVPCFAFSEILSLYWTSDRPQNRQNQLEKHLKLFTNTVAILRAVFLINYLCENDFFLKEEDNK